MTIFKYSITKYPNWLLL